MELRIDALAEMVEEAFMAGFRTGQMLRDTSEDRARELFAAQNLRAKLEEVVVEPAR